MGPLVITGVACFGAAVGIGLITAAAGGAIRQGAEPRALGGLYLTLTAFIEGIGVLGAVIGILAIVFARVGGASAAIVAAVPAVGGAVAGLIRASSAFGARMPLLALGIPLIAGLGILGVLVGALAVLNGEGQPIQGDTLPFATVGLVLFAVAIGHGESGARGFDELGDISSGGASAMGTPGAAESIRMRTIRRASILQMATVVAVAVAVILIVTNGQRPG